MRQECALRHDELERVARAVLTNAQVWKGPELRMLDFGQFDFGQLAEIELAEVEIGRSRTDADGVSSVSSFSLYFFLLLCLFTSLCFFSCSSSSLSLHFVFALFLFVPKNLN